MYQIPEQVPVGNCYTCASAGGDKVHYGDTPAKTFISSAIPVNPLGWICPGGAAAPQTCNLTIFTGADQNASACACKPGLFKPADQETCLPCNPGSICPYGFEEECPDNSYTSLPGQTECNLCSKNDNATGVLIVCPLSQLLRKCVYPYKSVPPKCVSCNMCSREYIGYTAGQVPCYT